METYGNTLSRCYREAQNYGQTIKNWWIPTSLFAILLIILYFFPLYFLYRSFGLTIPNDYMWRFVFWLPVVSLITIVFLEIRERILFRHIGIKVNKWFFDQESRDEYQKFKLKFYYDKLIEYKLLTGDRLKDIALLMKYSIFLNSEKEFWYTNPKIYIGAIAALLFGPLWSKTIDVIIDASTADTIWQHLALCCVLFLIAFIISLFLASLYRYYIVDFNKKSNNYKNVKRYVDLLLLNLETNSLRNT